MIEDLDLENNASDFFSDTNELPKDVMIEILPTSRSRSQYVPVTHFPFTVGRAYDNDLILSDETISPYHLVIGENALMTVKDLDSDNGTYVCHEGKKNKKRQKRKEKIIGEKIIDLPSTFTLGRTTIRLIRRSAEVQPAKPLASLSKMTELCSDLRLSLCLLTMYLLINIYYAIESQSLWLDWNAVVVGQFFELISPLFVAMLFSFISYLMTHRWRFPLHLSIACIAFILQQCISEMTEFLSYLLTSNSIADWVRTLLGVIVFSLLLSWQLRALSHLSVRRSHWTSVAIVIPIYMIILVQAILLKPEFIWQPEMHTVLRANDLRIDRTIPSISELTSEIQFELSNDVERALVKAHKNLKDND